MSAEHQDPWSLETRIGFRFAFIYLFLYCFPFPLDIFPGAVAAADRCRDSLHRAAVALAKPLFDVEMVANNGSGDTASNYIRVLLFFLTAVVGALVWSAVDRRRLRYPVLWGALHICVRYVLAATMFSYGFEKMLGLQFSTPSPGRLAETFGEASPMGLLWTFIGASPAYELFAGVLEVVGGAFLLFRRTTTLGALVLIGVLGNVVLLNFCYDVPVKLFSTHLWLMAVMLALPDFRRLANVLILQRPTSPKLSLDEREPKMRWAHRALKSVVLASLCYTSVAPSLQIFYDVPTKAGALDGAWEVSSTQGTGPLPIPPVAWRRISVGRYSVSLHRKDGGLVRYSIAEQDDKSLKLVRTEGQTKIETTLSFELLGENEAVLSSGLEGSAIGAHLIKIDTSKSLLITRGFHWISDAPFNR